MVEVKGRVRGVWVSPWTCFKNTQETRVVCEFCLTHSHTHTKLRVKNRPRPVKKTPMWPTWTCCPKWYPHLVAHLTSLKLSKAERMMSWPPLTKHTAASSSSTRALVLGGHMLRFSIWGVKVFYYHIILDVPHCSTVGFCHWGWEWSRWHSRDVASPG